MVCMVMQNMNYVGITKMNKYIIREVLRLIDEYDGRFTRQDYHILGQLYRVVNFCVDRNGCHHGDDGKFIEKNGAGGTTFDTVQTRSARQKRLQPNSVKQVKSYLFPNGIGESFSERKRAGLLLTAVGLCNEDISDCLDYSRAYVKLLVSSLLRDFGARNRTDLVVKAIETGALSLDEIPTIKVEGKATNKNLSPREKECMAYIATGGSNSEIANFLKIDLSTVRAHTENVFLKYGVGDRTLASIIALKNGDITLEDVKRRREELFR